MKKRIINALIIIILLIFIPSCGIIHFPKRVHDPEKFEFVKSLMENPDKFDSIVNSKYFYSYYPLKSSDNYWDFFIRTIKKDFSCGFTFDDDFEDNGTLSPEDAGGIENQKFYIQVISVKSKCKDKFIHFEFDSTKGKKWYFRYVKFTKDFFDNSYK